MRTNFQIFEGKSGLKKISKQEAIDKKMFGPVYHGTRPQNWENIFTQGFKIFYENPANTYLERPYDSGYFPPLHHLGYGIYFTSVKSIAKKFNFGTERNLKEFYLDVHNICEIRFGSKKNMMKWWLENGYNGKLGKVDRAKATKKMTNFLKSKYDAVWFKDKAMYGPALDGDQIVVFDPSKIYMVDESLSGKKEIGSKVKSTEDIIRKTFQIDSATGEHKHGFEIDVPKGTTGKIINRKSVQEIIKKFNFKPEENWAYGSEYIYTVKFNKGGTQHNLLDKDIE